VDEATVLDVVAAVVELVRTVVELERSVLVVEEEDTRVAEVEVELAGFRYPRTVNARAVRAAARRMTTATLANQRPPAGLGGRRRLRLRGASQGGSDAITLPLEKVKETCASRAIFCARDPTPCPVSCE
jgi:hypothetical protein